MSIEFDCKILGNKTTFDHSYYNLFSSGSQIYGPFHPAFGNMTTSFEFATFTVTIDEDEDTKELSALLQHFQDWVLPFPIPTQLTYDSNEADVILGLEDWYAFHYKAVMYPAAVMKLKLEALIGEGCLSRSWNTFGERQLLAKLTLLGRLDFAFLLVHSNMVFYRDRVRGKSIFRWLKEVVLPDTTSRSLLQRSGGRDRYNYLDLPLPEWTSPLLVSKQSTSISNGSDADGHASANPSPDLQLERSTMI